MSITSFSLGCKKYNKLDPRQRNATEALVTLIAEDMLPLSLVDSSAFKTFVDKLDSRYTLPSRKHLSTKLLVEEINSCLKLLLEGVDSVSVTLDLWSNRQMKGDSLVLPVILLLFY